MAASSSRSRRYDVFPSFSGEDVRNSFLSHLLKELDRKSIYTFIDHGIERSRPIGPELLSAIRESRISIVIFSKNYASSTWCLNELVKIHNCFNELDQMVIPVFYEVEPSDVRKQTGEFGEAFMKTCKGKTDDEIQRWIQALADVANMAGEDRRNWCNDANMIEKIVEDVSRKLITPSNCFGEFVGIEAHLEAMNSLLCLESEEARMLGILGPSGIGKSTIGRALFNQIYTQFHHHAFVSYKRTRQDDYGMKLCWEEQFLSEILCQKDIKVFQLGTVGQRLKYKKVLIVLDDVDDLELLKTLVGEPGWFGSGSRIIVITQDRQLLKAHDIDLIYEVKFPSKDLALKMLCQSAFRESSPPNGFMELTVEVAKLAGNLPLGLSVLGSSLRRKDRKEWMDMLPRLQNGLDGKIERILRVGYNRLDRNDQELFLYIAFASFFKAMRVSDIKDLLGDRVSTGLTMLADKSLIRITPLKTVEMHNLLQKLGREIVRAEYINNPEKRKYLVDVEDIRDVFTDKTGTENLLGIYLNTLDTKEAISIDEYSFQGMRNLQFLIVKCAYIFLWSRTLHLPQGHVYLPRKLRLLKWNEYPYKCLPCNFKGEFLVELTMKNSSLEKLWEGTQPLGSLKKLRMNGSRYLKELTDLSNAINLEEVYLSQCTSLVTLPSSIWNLLKLRTLDLKDCKKLKNFPIQLNLESLQCLDLRGCIRLKDFPQIYMSPCAKEYTIEVEGCFWNKNLPGLDYCFPQIYMSPCAKEYTIEVEDCFWNKNLPGLDYLGCLMACMPSKFRPEHLVNLTVNSNMLEKLWEGVQPLENLHVLDLSECENLTEIPDLSKATNLRRLDMNNCKSLVMIPSSVGNLNKLEILSMKGCTRLELLPDLSKATNLRYLDTNLPTGVNLISLNYLDLDGCSRLKSFPQISTNITHLYLDNTAIEEVPSWIENFDKLVKLRMSGCKELRRISSNIFKLVNLVDVDFSNCEGLTSLSVPEDPSQWASPFVFNPGSRFNFHNCFNLDWNSSELIIQSDVEYAILGGGEMSPYFTHQADGSSLTITLPQSSLSQESLRFKVCVMLDPPTNSEAGSIRIGVDCLFRGKHIMHDKSHPYCMEGHLIMFRFELSMKEVNNLPFESSSNNMRFGFSTNSLLTNFTLPQKIKRCGVRLFNSGSSEYEYNQGENDAKTSRNKMPTPMTVANTALNLELSLGLGGASSKSKIPMEMTAANKALGLELSLGLGGASAQVSSGSDCWNSFLTKWFLSKLK